MKDVPQSDYFPFGSGFRLSGGVVFNDNSIDATATTQATYTIGNTTYTAAQVGSLTGSIDFDDVAPYIGIGWGNPFSKESNWSFAIDIGVMYQGSPEASFTANGTLASNAAFLADLEREEQNLNDEMDEYKYYPVISCAVTYRF